MSPAVLRVAGREVHPATLSGLGDRVHLARPEIDLDVHIADVVGLLDAEQLEQAVLVTHSYAGIVITAVADRRPERLDTVVWLNSSPASDGTAIIECGSSVGCWRRMRVASCGIGDRLTRGPASGSATCPGARPVFEDADR